VSFQYVNSTPNMPLQAGSRRTDIFPKDSHPLSTPLATGWSIDWVAGPLPPAQSPSLLAGCDLPDATRKPLRKFALLIPTFSSTIPTPLTTDWSGFPGDGRNGFSDVRDGRADLRGRCGHRSLVHSAERIGGGGTGGQIAEKLTKGPEAVKDQQHRSSGQQR